MNTKQPKIVNRLVWMILLMFAVGVFFLGFDSDWGFRIAGGVGVLIGFMGVMFDWQLD